MEDTGWRTINGVHVQIGKDGTILKGPKALQKSEIQSKLKKQFGKRKYKQLSDKEIEEYQKKSNEVYEKLTEEEKKALESYTKAEFKNINEELVEADGENFKYYVKEIKNIDSAINKMEVPDDIIVYKMTNYDYFTRYAKGDEFKLKNYNSTTIKENEIELFQEKKWQSGYNYCELKIKVPKGTKGLYIGENNNLAHNEYELLLPRNLTYREVEFNDNGKIPVIELEVVK